MLPSMGSFVYTWTTKEYCNYPSDCGLSLLHLCVGVRNKSSRFNVIQKALLERESDDMFAEDGCRPYGACGTCAAPASLRRDPSEQGGRFSGCLRRAPQRSGAAPASLQVGQKGFDSLGQVRFFITTRHRGNTHTYCVIS